MQSSKYFFFLFLFEKFKPIAYKLNIFTANIFYSYSFSVFFIAKFDIMACNSCTYSIDSFWKKKKKIFFTYSHIPDHHTSSILKVPLYSADLLKMKLLTAKFSDPRSLTF